MNLVFYFRGTDTILLKCHYIVTHQAENVHVFCDLIRQFSSWTLASDIVVYFVGFVVCCCSKMDGDNVNGM